MAENNNSDGGIGFVGLLTIVFIVLKLTKVVAWSWWWVLSPLWIIGSIIILILLATILLMWIDGRKARKLSHHNFD